MRRQVLTVMLALFPAGLPAAAHECSYGIARPYVIEKTCDEDGLSCTARMLYAPGENPGLARHGSYWYPRAEGYVKVLPPECPANPQGHLPHVNEDSGDNFGKDA